LPPTGHPTGFVNYGNYFNIPSLPGPGARTAPFPRRLR
jgi:hypothetical protein